MKHATGRALAQVRHGAGNRIEHLALARHARQAREQAGRIGMARVVEEPVDAALFDDSAAIHHRDAPRGFRHQAEVMCDQDHCGAGPSAHVGEHLHDLRLDRHVQRGGGFVGNEKGRIIRDRHGDHRALAHAAGKFIGILGGATRRVRNADARQELDHAIPDGAARQRGVVDADRFRNLTADAPHRIERRHRVLKDHRQLAAANGAHRIEREARNIAATQPDFAAHDPQARRQQPHDGQHRDALARAGLAHQPEHVIRRDIERDAVDQANRALGGSASTTRSRTDRSGLAVGHRSQVRMRGGALPRRPAGAPD